MSGLEGERVPAGNVLVIGGGLAGCAAALALGRAGVPVMLLEAKSRLGGRAGSYTDPVTGQSIDYCQHVGMGCCSGLRQLIDMLGQNDDWAIERELFFYGPEPHQRRVLRALPMLPAPLHLSGWLWGWPGLSMRDRLQIGYGMLALNRIRLNDSAYDSAKDSAIVALDRQSAHEWLVKHGQSLTAITRFWATIVVSALGEDLERVGVLPMAKVFQDGFLRKRDAYHLLIPKWPLDALFGRRMTTALEQAKVDLRFNHAVTKIEWQQGRPNLVRLTNGQSIDVADRRVVIAVPWHVWPSLVQRNAHSKSIESIADGAAQLASSPISGVHTWWDRAWLPSRHAVMVGRLCQWIFPKIEPGSASLSSPSSEREGGAKSEHYYQIVISASRGLPKGDLSAAREMILNDLQSLFPEAREAQLLRLKVVTDPQAVFSVQPGVDQHRPPSSTFIDGIVIAGDWVRTGWPATMESAIRSGFQAADCILGR